jgi:hypothetical protein
MNWIWSDYTPRRRIKTLIAVVALISIGPVHAEDRTFFACSWTALGLFHAINDFTLGVPLANAQSAEARTDDSVELVYKIAKKEGVERAYFLAHFNYQKCAGEVKVTPNTSSPAEEAYGICAYKTATRTTHSRSNRERHSAQSNETRNTKAVP